MKRIFTLMVLSLVAILPALAEKVIVSTTLPANGKPEHVYTMKNANGLASNALTAPTQTADNYGLFAFYPAEVEGAYYIYSYKAKKWLSYTQSSSYNNGINFVQMVDNKPTTAYFKVNNYSGDNYEIQPYTSSGSNDKYLNWFAGTSQNPLDGTTTLGLWQQSGSADGGSRWTFEEVELRTYTYAITLPEGVSIQIGGQSYTDGQTYVSEERLKKSDVAVPTLAGSFSVLSINDVAGTLSVAYVPIPAQPATAPYTLASVYPMQQDHVGTALLTESNGVYTLSNKVLAASFVKVNDALFFAGSSAMNLEAGTEPFTIAFGSGDNVPASAMTLKSVETVDLVGSNDSIGGADHFNGKALVAKYSYMYKEQQIDVLWKAVLRDGSHYLRTEMELTGVGNVDMYDVIPLIYNVNTREAGSTPKVVGNTRGAVLMSNKIFAGLENPVAYNTVGGAAGEEDLWDLTNTLSPVTLTATSWQQVAEEQVPNRVTEATGISYPNVLAYSQEGVTLTKGQRVEVMVKYTNGNHRLNFCGADLNDASGTIAANDYHSGFSGSQHSNNTFTLIAPYDGTFSIRVFVENKTESIDAGSTLTTKIYSMKQGVVVDTDIVSIQGRWSRNTTLAAGETWKISGVVGLIAQDGNEAETDITLTQKRRSFLAYSERERAVPWRANPAYISWYELNINRNNAQDPTQNMTADQVLDVISHWRKDFYNRYHVAPNSFVIDDGWDNYGTWTFHANFPNEMKDMAASAEEMGAGVGAWLGPVGGYGTSGTYRRQYWSDKGGMVLSNPAYYQVFKDAAYNLTRNQGDFRFFKFDGISAQFSATGPDAGDTGNENAEGIIRLERYVRENLKRDIFFNTTVGTWASPFWYHYTDATWRQENDYGTAGNNSSDRERWITYRDRLVYQNYVSNSPVCPINTLMTHGFILSVYGSVSKDMSYEACLRELRCAFLCGSGMVELYNDYPLTNSIANGQLWADLAECIAWQKRNADVLPDAHWVGGNPWTGSQHEVYGWAAWNGTKASLALRNGDDNAKTFTFTLRKALNIPANVSGSIILRKAFGVQAALEGLTEGQAINIDEQLTVKLPGSSVYGFEGINAESAAHAVSHITLTAENAEASVSVGKTIVVRAEVNADATFPAIEWSSSNESIATVRGGLVCAVAEGDVTITATATDGSNVSASITIHVVPKTAEPYATNFDKDAKATRSDRYIKSLSFTAGEDAAQTIAVDIVQPYVDKSADEACLLTCHAGDRIQVAFDRAGGWMNGYFYIDLDQNKQFSFREGSTDQSGSELMTFSFYSGDFNNDSQGVNSAGTSLTGGARNTMACPAFTLPANLAEGDYRVRFKMDWNSVDAGGQIGADGTVNGTNGFLANGGQIVDATLRVVTADAIATPLANGEKAVRYDLSGRRLHNVPQHGLYIEGKQKKVK